MTQIASKHNKTILAVSPQTEDSPLDVDTLALAQFFFIVVAPLKYVLAQMTNMETPAYRFSRHRTKLNLIAIAAFPSAISALAAAVPCAVSSFSRYQIDKDKS
ncbi:hypothetical protein ACFLYO_02210 [Chloroflexota bacterium]